MEMDERHSRFGPHYSHFVQNGPKREIRLQIEGVCLPLARTSKYRHNKAGKFHPVKRDCLPSGGLYDMFLSRINVNLRYKGVKSIGIIEIRPLSEEAYHSSVRLPLECRSTFVQ
jgi:hypothetical protein